MTIELPDDFDPRASLRADMGLAGERDRRLKRHGVSRAGQFPPEVPWDLMGRPRSGYTPPAPGISTPTNGGIATVDPRLTRILNGGGE